MKLLSITFGLLLASSAAFATPIRPDLKKLLDTPPPITHFAPARAGWKGTDGASTSAAQAAAIETLGQAARQRGIRESLIRAATPDWRVFLSLALLILLLRVLRARATQPSPIASYPVPVDAIDLIRHRPAA